ncbi:MAG: HNH endonuclease [Planococcus donghaensis]
MGILRFTLGGTAKLAGKATNSAVKGASMLISKKSPETGEFFEDVGRGIINASVTSIDTVSQFADGGIQTVYGAATKNQSTVEAGFKEMKTPVKRTVKGIGHTITSIAKNVDKTATGLMNGNIDEAKAGSKNLLKTTAILITAIGVVDVLNGIEMADAEEFETQNGASIGETHPVTGVPFEEKTVYHNGHLYDGNFPVFEASFEAELNKNQYLMSDQAHNQVANLKLFYAIENNPALADALGLNQTEINELQSSVTPEGYAWHHHEEPGKLQLINQEIHKQTGHTGGREIWGGGTEFR